MNDLSSLPLNIELDEWYNHLLHAYSSLMPCCLLCPSAAAWAGHEKIGEFQASGFLFKDTVEVNAFDDPESE